MRSGLIFNPNPAKPPNVTHKLSHKLANTMDVQAQEPDSKSAITVTVLVTGANRYPNLDPCISSSKQSKTANQYLQRSRLCDMLPSHRRIPLHTPPIAETTPPLLYP